MAQFETWLKSDLQEPVRIVTVHGNVFTQDNMANRIGVEVTDGGEAATLSGSVLGYIIRADESTVVQTGSLSGNRAWVDLPENAYAVPGQIQVAIRLVAGDVKTVLGALTGYVARSTTDTIIDPGSAIPIIPSGGSAGQVLAKVSAEDYDTAWVNQSGGGGTSDYTDLTNKPKINSVTLTGNKSLSDLSIASVSDLAGKQAKITASGILKGDGSGGVTAATADTDYGTYSKPSGGIPSADMASAVQTSLGKADSAYQKPSGGIPATDIASGVIPDVSGKLDAPSVAGTNGQVLTSNGQGGQTWQTPQGGGTVDDTLSIGGAAADAAKVGEVKADLESDISDLSLRLDRYYPALTVGALDVSTGGEASAINRMRTGFIPTRNVRALVALEYKAYVIYYNKYRQFAANGGGWVSGVLSIGNTYPYFRLLIANDNISDFTGQNENRTIVTIETTAKSVDDRIDTLQSYVNGYYPDIVVAMMNVANGGINFAYTNRATSEIIDGRYKYITASSGYSYYLVYYNSSLAYAANSGGWLTGAHEISNYPYYRILFKNDSISDWTGLTNTFCYLEIEKSDKRHVYTIGQNDNVAQVLTEAMQYRGSVVYIEPYEHDCITEWQAFYGNNYFTNMSSGEGLGLTNDIHIIGRSGHKLKCWYTGSNDYVMEHFSLFNNPHGGSGYTLENVCIDTKKIRYCVHDERGSDTVPYKVRFKHCVMSQDQTGSTWDNSRACIGGGVGMSADIVVEDCIFNTVTSSAHLDSLAYHNSDANGAAANAQSSIVIKNCYCAGTSTIQLMHHGASTRKTPVLVADCSMGSPMEIISNTGGTDNFEICQINNIVRTRAPLDGDFLVYSASAGSYVPTTMSSWQGGSY